MKRVCLLFLSLLAAGTASARDARLETRFYDPAQIVVLNGRIDTQSTVQFAIDERIENIAVGDSASWQVTPNKRASLLFVKPMKTPARSNMTVVTNERTYLFDLVARPGLVPVYMLRFTYPPSPKPSIVALAAPIAPAPATAEKPRTPADLNFAWKASGSKQLLPARTFDDGKSTWLAWPKDATLPAILTRDATGKEGPVNYTARGDYIVIDGVPPQLVLREGKQMAMLVSTPRSQAPEPAPPLPSSDRTASNAQ